jgi:hypothetical protein
VLMVALVIFGVLINLEGWRWWRDTASASTIGP